LILQLLHHDATNVNQVDKFDWPPLLEACSRLDARATSLLVNGGANLGFRNQHQFDVLKAVDTSKKDLAAKRWMSCLVVSNGFRFEESKVQLNPDDRQTLEREKSFFSSRTIPVSNPPFFRAGPLGPAMPQLQGVVHSDRTPLPLPLLWPCPMRRLLQVEGLQYSGTG